MLRYVMLSLTVLLSGCDASNPPGISESLVSRNSEAVLPYSFAPGRREIDPAERRRIEQFLNGFDLTHADILVISVPGPSDGSASRGRKTELRSMMAQYPARLNLVDDGGLPGISAAKDRGIIRVIRPYATNTVCKAAAGEPGCANAGNLARMVAVPADVILPGLGRRFIPADQADPVLSKIAPALP